MKTPILLDALPGLERWLGHVFNVLGGFMAACGFLLAALAWNLDRRLPGTSAYWFAWQAFHPDTELGEATD